MLSIFINILLVIDVIVCLLLILLVLMQRPKNEGLGAAFGGGMTESLFGAETTNVLVKGTRLFGAMFLGLTLLISILYTHKDSSSVQSELIKKKSAPAAPAASPVTGATDDASQKIKAAILKQIEEQKNGTAPSASAAPSAAPAASPAPVASAAPTAAPSPAATPAPSPAASPAEPK